jgi:hypothetical protein
MNSKDLKGLCEAYSGVYTPQELTEEQVWEEIYEDYLEEAPQGDIGARFGRGLVGALRDLPSATMAQLQGRENEALRRQGQRGTNLKTLLRTGKLPSNNQGSAKKVSTPKPEPQKPAAAPVAQTRPASPSPRPAAAPVAQTRPASPSPRPAAAPVAQTRPASPSPRPAAAPVAQPKPTTSAPGTKAAGPESIKPKTPNPLLAGGDIRRMQQASQMRQKGIDITSNQIAAAERTKPTTTKKESTEWGSTSKLVDDIANLYQSVYEAKKVDQDGDGDNDFADVRIARLIASGMSKEEAIAKVKNKPYNEEVEIDESMISGPRKDRMLSLANHPRTSGKDRGNIHNIAVRNDTGPTYRKKSTGGKGSRFPGYGDRGAGNKAARRAGNEPMRGNTRKEELELWVQELINEGYDLSDYTWDEIVEIYEETEEEKKKNERRARVAELQASGRVMTSSRRTSERAKERREEQKAERLERLANAALEDERGAKGRSSTPMGSTQPTSKESAPKANRKLSSSMKKDTLASKADELLRMLQNENFQLWTNELLDEGYELDNWTDEELVELYIEIFG